MTGNGGRCAAQIGRMSSSSAAGFSGEVIVGKIPTHGRPCLDQCQKPGSLSPFMPSIADNMTAHRHTAISATLRQSRMFASLSPEDLSAVAAVCTLRTLQKGETLFRQGEKSEGFYVMQTGSVSIFSLTPDGREQIICLFRPPESFAEVDRKSTRLNSSHVKISYAVFCLKKKTI